MFLTNLELENCLEYQNKITDKSLSTRLLTPLWSLLVRFVPEDVAPNALQLVGLICLMHAYYLCFAHMDKSPVITLAFCVIFICMFYTLDQISLIHARRTLNDTPLTVFFQCVVSSVATIFLVLILCRAMQLEDLDLVWSCVQISQLVLLNVHIHGFVKQFIKYFLFTGPGEAVSLFVFLLLLRLLLGLDVLWTLLEVLVLFTCNFWSLFYPPAAESHVHLHLNTVIPAVHKLCMVLTFGRVWMITRKNHKSTRNGVVLCLLLRLLISYTNSLLAPVSLADCICDGLFLALVTSDVLLARMAQRELHPWIPIFAVVSAFSDFAVVVCFCFYFFKVLSEISWKSKLPIMSINRNVYCDGVYDLCHLGHMKVFEKAIIHGTRLFVGVCSDQDVAAYKRLPYMTTAEREATVAQCKFVYKVISNAPCTKGALNEEFIRKHRIHIVCCSEEYDKPTDMWYAVPRRMGILRVLPRTEGVSTSELVARIQSRFCEEGKDAPKDAVK